MTETASPPREASLSRELTDLLTELSRALHKHAIYPYQHPSLEPAVEAVARRISPLLRERGSLSLGVARNQLIIEGVATDPGRPLLRELAERLHRHQLGAISFTRGVRRDELEAFLGTVAVDAGQSGDPLGLVPPEELPSWEHIRLHPVTYESLEMVGEREGEDGGGPGRRVAELWMGLARAALATDEGEPPPSADADVVADAISARAREAAYDQVVVGHLLQLADELGQTRGANTDAVRGRLARLIARLDADTLERLLRMGGEAEQRRRFALGAADSFSVEAVVRIVEATARASGRTISDSLLRLFSKLASHAGEGSGAARRRAEEELRGQVRRLVEGWSLEDPNPEGYTEALGGLARAHPHRLGGDRVHPPESGRVVRMGIEVGIVGRRIRAAVRDLLDAGEAGEVVDILEEAPRGEPAVRALWEMVATPERVRELLEADPVDFDLLDRLLARLGSGAADALLDALVASEVRSTRRWILDRLGTLGPEVGPLAVERLDDERWFVKRNMLVLLARLESRPPGFSAEPFYGHADPRVRREALKILLEEPGSRDRALCRALGDPDTRTVRLALTAAREHCPEAAVPHIVRLIADPETPATVKVAAVGALRGVGEPLALQRLVKVASGGRTLLGRRKLAEKSPVLVEALRVLRTTWSGEPEAERILDLARDSGDPELEEVAGGEDG